MFASKMLSNMTEIVRIPCGPFILQSLLLLLLVSLCFGHLVIVVVAGLTLFYLLSFYFLNLKKLIYLF